MSTSADYSGLESSIWLATNELFELPAIAEEDEVASLHDSAQGVGGDEKLFVENPPPAKRRRVTAACASCGQQFTEKRSLYRHQRSARSCQLSTLVQEHYPCSSCTRIFTRADTLSRHENERHHFLGRRKTANVVHSTLNVPSSDTFSDPADDQAMPLWHENTQGNSSERSMVDEIDSEPSDSPFIATADDVSESDQGMLATFHVHAEGAEDQKDNQAEVRTPTGSAMHVTSDDDTRSVRSTRSVASLLRKFNLPFRSSSSLERLGASRGFSAFKKNLPCPACKKPFESNSAKLLQHIRSHVRDWTREFVCSECDIGFQCQEDLIFHMTSASRGSCGFIASDHACTGHHPPYELGDSSELSSHDRLTLCTFLRHWEQAQLEALIVGIDELSLGHSNLDSDRWSFSLLRRRPSSIGSSAIIPPSFRSEPKYFNVNLKKVTRIRTIEQGLASISKAGLSPLIRRRAAENDALLRTKTLNESLAQAIMEDDLNRTKLLLDSGAEINAHLHGDALPLKALLLYRNNDPLWHHNNDWISRVVHLRPEFVTPLALARLNHRPRTARLLESFGALDDLECRTSLPIPDFSSVAMVLKPPGLVAHLLRNNAAARNDWSHGQRLAPATARDLSTFITTPASFSAPLERLVQWLIHFNHSLGLQVVLERGASPNKILPNGFVPLKYALHKRSSECALVLICHDIETDDATMCEIILNVLKDISKLDPRAGRILSLLIEGLPWTQNASARTFLLAQAIQASGSETLKMVLKKHINCVDEWPSKDSLDKRSLNKHLLWGPPISFAARHGHFEAVKTLLSYGADVAQTGGFYGTPLRTAVCSHKVDIVQLLLDAGADPNQLYSPSEPLFYWATVNGSVEMASALVRSGAHLDENAMVTAAHRGRLALAKYFLELRVDINYNDAKLGTPICAALLKPRHCSDYLAMVEFLLNNGADPALVGPHGNALQVAMSLREERERGFFEQDLLPEINVAIHLLREAMGLPTSSVCKWRALLPVVELS